MDSGRGRPTHTLVVGSSPHSVYFVEASDGRALSHISCIVWRLSDLPPSVLPPSTTHQANLRHHSMASAICTPDAARRMGVATLGPYKVPTSVQGTEMRHRRVELIGITQPSRN